MNHGESPNFFDPEQGRVNRLEVEFKDITQSEQRRRFNSFSEGQPSIEKQPRMNIKVAPVGTIVRLSRNMQR